MRNWLLNSTALHAPAGPASGPASDSAPTPDAGAAPAPETGPSSTELKNLLDFDPFEPEPASGQEGEGKTPPAPVPAGKEKKAGDEQVPPSGAETPPPKPDPVSQQLQEVANLLRLQTEANARPKSDVNAGAKPKGPKFNLTIPEAISKAMLTSEEPTERAAALVEFANGLSNLVYEETMKEVRGHLTALVQRIPEISRNQVTELTTQQEMQRDFWDSVAGSAIPEAQRLPRTKEMGQFVALTAQNLAMELKRKGQEPAWTPEFRNEIVQRVYAALGRQAPGQQQRPNGNGAAPIQRQPKPNAFASGAGSRGGDQVQYKTDLEKDIAEIFD